MTVRGTVLLILLALDQRRRARRPTCRLPVSDLRRTALPQVPRPLASCWHPHHRTHSLLAIRLHVMAYSP